MDLIPVMAEYILSADRYLPDHISDEAKSFAKMLKTNKQQTIGQISSGLKNRIIRRRYASGIG